MKYFITLFFTLVMLACIVSCDYDNKENTDIFRNWIGKKITIPENIDIKILGEEITDKNIINKKNKIFVYVDSLGCTACNMELGAWILRITDLYDSGIEIPVLFSVHSNDYSGLEKELSSMYFECPIIYDYNNDIERLNKFPAKKEYRTFLLDEENNVILIGAPTHNDKLWELYKRQIRELTAKE